MHRAKKFLPFSFFSSKIHLLSFFISNCLANWWPVEWTEKHARTLLFTAQPSPLTDHSPSLCYQLHPQNSPSLPFLSSIFCPAFLAQIPSDHFFFQPCTCCISFVFFIDHLPHCTSAIHEVWWRMCPTYSSNLTTLYVSFYVSSSLSWYFHFHFLFEPPPLLVCYISHFSFANPEPDRVSLPSLSGRPHLKA